MYLSNKSVLGLGSLSGDLPSRNDLPLAANQPTDQCHHDQYQNESNEEDLGGCLVMIIMSQVVCLSKA